MEIDWIVNGALATGCLGLGYLAVSKELTLRKRDLVSQMHEQLLMSAERVADSEALSICHVSRSGKVISGSRGLGLLFGLNEPVGHLERLDDVLNPASSATLNERLHQAVGLQTANEVVLHAPLGRLRIEIQPVGGDLVCLFQKLLPTTRHQLQHHSENLEKIASNRAQRISKLKEGLRKAKIELAEVQKVAHKDPLTQCLNRLGFAERLKNEVQRARRKGQTLGVLMLDIDKFKNINDQYGHALGDQALIFLGDTLSRLVRRDAGDLVARLGGDEFIVVLSDATLEHAKRTLQMARTVLAESPIPGCSDTSLRLQISGGAVTLNPAKDELGEVIKMADSAMYKNKRRGNLTSVVENLE